MNQWSHRAACAGVDPTLTLFFDAVLTNGTTVRANNDHLTVREDYCVKCPVRRECLTDAMEVEGTTSGKYRFGIWGGLTPAQRVSLRHRGIHCPECGAVLDPLGFVLGELECDCGWARTVQPLPENGDDWRAKHDALAARVVAWLLEHTEAGETVPSPTALAKTLSARKADVVRVYESLLYDGTLAKRRREYVRQGSTRVLRTWRPPHVAA